jgi:hypothetical protein
LLAKGIFSQSGEKMKRIILALVISSFAVSSAMAATKSCASMAVGQDGKALTGDAKTSYVDACKKKWEDACDAKAVSKGGKALSGAARKSFMAKCLKGA